MPDPKDAPSRRIYGRRSGHKLRSTQARLMGTLLPELQIDLSGPELATPADLFPHSPNAIWLEIGFGAGEHLVWQARTHSDAGLIGCEPFRNGMAKLLGQIADHQLRNVRVYDGDGRDLLEALGTATLSKVFILYPDPWPKRRHHKRRLINQATLDELARVLKSDAELRIVTDIGEHARWILAHLTRHQAFRWQARKAAHWRVRPSDWPATRYERKAVEEGRTPYYLIFSRL